MALQVAATNYTHKYIYVMFLHFYFFSFLASIKGCYRKSNIGNTEIKNGIETERTDFLDLVSHSIV